MIKQLKEHLEKISMISKDADLLLDKISELEARCKAVLGYEESEPDNVKNANQALAKPRYRNHPAFNAVTLYGRRACSGDVYWTITNISKMLVHLFGAGHIQAENEYRLDFFGGARALNRLLVRLGMQTFAGNGYNITDAYINFIFIKNGRSRNPRWHIHKLIEKLLEMGIIKLL